jgi:polar amino acid transport system substrate-binding protein
MKATLGWFPSVAAVLLVAACATPTTLPTNEERAALAPTGKLRLALLATNATNPKNPATGEIGGPAVDVGKELASRLGVPFEIVGYRTVSEFVGSAGKGEWDITSIGINPEREKLFNFTAPYMQIESGYLVRGMGIRTIAEVDRPGVRISVLERGDSDVLLTKMLRHATLVRTKTVPDALEALKSGRADVHSNIKTFLIPSLKGVPDGRILDGYWQIQPIAYAVQKGNPGADYVRRVVGELKAKGFTKEAVERAGIPGLMVAP